VLGRKRELRIDAGSFILCGLGASAVHFLFVLLRAPSWISIFQRNKKRPGILPRRLENVLLSRGETDYFFFAGFFFVVFLAVFLAAAITLPPFFRG
jgi:hypothetical protein